MPVKEDKEMKEINQELRDINRDEELNSTRVQNEQLMKANTELQHQIEALKLQVSRLLAAYSNLFDSYLTVK